MGVGRFDAEIVKEAEFKIRCGDAGERVDVTDGDVVAGDDGVGDGGDLRAVDRPCNDVACLFQDDFVPTEGLRAVVSGAGLRCRCESGLGAWDRFAGESGGVVGVAVIRGGIGVVRGCINPRVGADEC